MVTGFAQTVTVHSRICRQTWARLFYWLRSYDLTGSGCVHFNYGDAIQFFGVDNSTLYRWLNSGRKIGAFRYYRRSGDNFTVYLGSKSVVSAALGLADWGAATIINREELASPNFRDTVTAAQADWMQARSHTAAHRQAKANGIKKPQIAKPDLRRAMDASRPTLQYFRKKQPTGASQNGIGKSLNLSPRSVRRHLQPVPRVQQAHKIPYGQAWAEIEIAAETGIRPTCFIRGNEAFRFGCNTYDLSFERKSEKTQRLKHLFFLCQILRSRRIGQYKEYLWIEDLNCSWFSNFDLEVLINFNSFGKFRLEVLRQIREFGRTSQAGQK